MKGFVLDKVEDFIAWFGIPILILLLLLAMTGVAMAVMPGTQPGQQNAEKPLSQTFAVDDIDTDIGTYRYDRGSDTWRRHYSLEEQKRILDSLPEPRLPPERVATPQPVQDRGGSDRDRGGSDRGDSGGSRDHHGSRDRHDHHGHHHHHHARPRYSFGFGLAPYPAPRPRYYTPVYPTYPYYYAPPPPPVYPYYVAPAPEPEPRDYFYFRYSK